MELCSRRLIFTEFLDQLNENNIFRGRLLSRNPWKRSDIPEPKDACVYLSWNKMVTTNLCLPVSFSLLPIFINQSEKQCIYKVEFQNTRFSLPRQNGDWWERISKRGGRDDTLEYIWILVVQNMRKSYFRNGAYHFLALNTDANKNMF
jgi:hypothetical protein